MASLLMVRFAGMRPGLEHDAGSASRKKSMRMMDNALCTAK